jgi:hypothetical protein
VIVQEVYRLWFGVGCYSNGFAPTSTQLQLLAAQTVIILHATSASTLSHPIDVSAVNPRFLDPNLRATFSMFYDEDEDDERKTKTDTQ